MSATAARSAAPTHAVLMWADERNIYAQLPSQNGPYVAQFPRSEGGLSQALHTMGAMHIEHSGEPYIRQDIPPKALREAGLTQNDRDATLLVLKKLGVI